MAAVTSAIFVMALVCGKPTFYFDEIVYADNKVDYTFEIMDRRINPKGVEYVMKRFELAKKLNYEIILMEQVQMTGQKCVKGTNVIAT
jgi:hypothetical protein